jgi:hypothetical protein
MRRKILHSNGKTVLTRPSQDSTRSGNNMVITSGVNNGTPAAISAGEGTYTIGSSTSSKSTVTFGSGSSKKTVYVNSNTVIVVRDKNDKYTVYNGVKNLPTISSGNVLWSALTRDGDTYAKLLYIQADGKITNNSRKNIYLVADEDARVSDDGTNKYYTFKGVVDGVINESINLNYDDDDTAKVIAQLLAADGNDQLLSTYSVNGSLYEVDLSDEVQDSTSPETGKILSDSDHITKITGTTIEFVSGSYALADDCVFYSVNSHDELVASTQYGLRTTKAPDDISTYYDFVGFTLNNDLEITGLYWNVK